MTLFRLNKGALVLLLLLTSAVFVVFKVAMYDGVLKGRASSLHQGELSIETRQLSNEKEAKLPGNARGMLLLRIIKRQVSLSRVSVLNVGHAKVAV